MAQKNLKEMCTCVILWLYVPIVMRFRKAFMEEFQLFNTNSLFLL